MTIDSFVLLLGVFLCLCHPPREAMRCPQQCPLYNDTSGGPWPRPQLSACKVVSSSVTGFVSLLVITPESRYSRVKSSLQKTPDTIISVSLHCHQKIWELPPDFLMILLRLCFEIMLVMFLLFSIQDNDNIEY